MRESVSESEFVRERLTYRDVKDLKTFLDLVGAGFGSGFSTRIPDPDPRQKKEWRKCFKSY